MGFFDYLGTVYRDTLILFAFGIIGVAAAMRIIKHAFFDQLEKWIKKACGEEGKALAIFSTVKAILCTVISAALSFAAIWCLMKILPFPADNNKALLPFYFIPFYYLQLVLDLKGLKILTNKLFGIDRPAAAEEEPDYSEKEEKPRIFKVKGKRYTENEDGTLVPVEE